MGIPLKITYTTQSITNCRINKIQAHAISYIFSLVENYSNEICYQQSISFNLDLFLETLCGCQFFKCNFIKSWVPQYSYWGSGRDLKIRGNKTETACEILQGLHLKIFSVIWVSWPFKFLLSPISCKLWRHVDLYSIAAFNVTAKDHRFHIKLGYCCFAKTATLMCQLKSHRKRSMFTSTNVNIRHDI